MIKVSTLYPATFGARFDHDYYRDHHMPLAARLLGEACIFYTIDRGLTGVDGGEPPFVAACHIYSDNLEVFMDAFRAKGGEINADIPNYTSLKPVVQISEAVSDEQPPRGRKER